MTPAELNFLSNFLNGFVHRAASDEYWFGLLQEPQLRTIKRLLDAGYVAPAPLAAKLASALTATELRTLLRERRLKASGRKAECIERLIEADPVGSAAAVSGIESYICTELGRELAEAFVMAEAKKRQTAEAESWRYLQQGDVRAAMAVVGAYRRDQMIDWHDRDTGPSRDDSGRLQLILAILVARPRLLHGMGDDEWRTAQVAAAMMDLWGARVAGSWLPENFAGATNLDRETTVRMIMFEAKSRTDLAAFRASGITRVEVLGGGDSCPACQEIAGKRFDLADAPTIPYEQCTSEMGCRCMLLPVVE